MSGGKLIVLPSAGSRMSEEEATARKRAADELRDMAKLVESGMLNGVLAFSLSKDNRLHRVMFGSAETTALLALFSIQDTSETLFQPSEFRKALSDMVREEAEAESQPPPSEE